MRRCTSMVSSSSKQVFHSALVSRSDAILYADGVIIEAPLRTILRALLSSTFLNFCLMRSSMSRT